MMKCTVLTAAALLTTSSALAQQTEVTIKVEQIAPGVAVLFGSGGNIGLSYGEDGNVLIDDQFAPLTPKILAAVATVDPDPVKFLINTHWHGDHTGGNENLGKAGAVIMAHDNVRVRLATGATSGAGTPRARTIPPAPSVALPVVTYHDGLSLHVNGDEIRTHHMRNAHTDGDSVVHWKKANVIHMGDLFMNKVSLPYVDLSSGGDVRGFVAAADKVLAMTNAETKIIPGHGPMATRADLQAWRNLISDVIAKVEAGIKAKKSLAQIQAMKPAAAYEVQGAFISGDAFVKAVYESLSKPAAPHKAHH
jgi:cyclase